MTTTNKPAQINGRPVVYLTPLAHNQKVTINGKDAYILTINGMWADEAIRYNGKMTPAEFRAHNTECCEKHALPVEEVCINLEATCLHTGTIVKENRVALSIGDLVEVERKSYLIAGAPNGNFQAVPV